MEFSKTLLLLQLNVWLIVILWYYIDVQAPRPSAFNGIVYLFIEIKQNKVSQANQNVNKMVYWYLIIILHLSTRGTGFVLFNGSLF